MKTNLQILGIGRYIQTKEIICNMVINTFIVVIVSLSNKHCAACIEIKHCYAMGKSFGLKEDFKYVKLSKLSRS